MLSLKDLPCCHESIDYDHCKSLVDFQLDCVSACRAENHDTHLSSSSISVGAHCTFMTVDELLHKFYVSWNSDRQTDRGQPLTFRHNNVMTMELIFFTNQLILLLVHFVRGNYLNKRCGLHSFLQTRNLNQHAIIFTTDIYYV